MKRTLPWLAAFAMVLLASCEAPIAPTELNLGIPLGVVEGEYGYNINGQIFDSHAPFGGEGTASLLPLTGHGAGAVQLSLYFFYDFGNGLFGNVGFYIPLINPHSQSLSIFGTSSTKDPQATAYCLCDSNGFIWYDAISGTVNITKFDTENDFVSGTFEFTASETSPNADLNKTVTITSGYFYNIAIGEGGYGQGSVTAEVNGNAFTTNRGGYEMAYADSEFEGLNLFGNGQGTLLGTDISIQRIPFRIGAYAMDSSTVNLDSIPIFLYQSGEENLSTQNGGSSGTLTITSCDVIHRRISGTFQFSGVDSLGNTVTITNGVINNVQWEP